MTTADALRHEIDNTPEPILREAYDFLMFLKSRNAAQSPNRMPSESLPPVAEWPDFMGRLKAMYGDRVFSDSQEIMDYMRQDRF